MTRPAITTPSVARLAINDERLKEPLLWLQLPVLSPEAYRPLADPVLPLRYPHVNFSLPTRRLSARVGFWRSDTERHGRGRLTNQGRESDTGTAPRESRPCILLVEDDATISDLLAYNLRQAGYDVRQERTGTGGVKAALAGNGDLVLLDLMLPGLDGLSAAREIARRRPGLPVIMLTARNDRETMLQGFEAGAADYVTKPFDMDVLLARISARLKSRETAPVERRRLHVGDAVIDPDERSLSGPAGKVELKPREFGLLELLLEEPGRLFEREEIAERVWHHRYLPGSRTLDVHVRRVRRKLSDAGCHTRIETERGVGYRAVASPTRSDDEHEREDDTP
jgi:DNA-binding response OmpR family regulator